MATNYFVSTSGSSGNSGLSTLLPKDTVAHAMAAASAGDTISGKGGDTFRELMQLTHANMTLNAYGTGKPTARGADVATGWGAAGVGTNTYSVALTTSPNMVFNGATRAIHGASSSTLTDGQWFWAANVLYFRSDAGNPDTVPLVIEAAVRSYALDTNSQNGWTLDSWILDRSNASESGLYAHVSPMGFLVNNCEFYDHYGQGIHISGASLGGTVQFSIFMRNGLDAIWYSENPNQNQFVLHCTMTGNAWRTDGTADFSGGVRGCVQSGEWAYNVVSANGAGSSRSDGSAHGMYLAPDTLNCTLAIHHNDCGLHTKGDGIKAASSCTLFWNVSHENTWQGFELGLNTTHDIVIVAHHNTAWKNGGSAFSIQHGATGAGTLTVKLYNATCYLNCQLIQEEITLQTDLTAFEMKNVIIYSKTGGKYVGVHATITGTMAVDYNDYWNGSATPFLWGGSNLSLAGWKSTSGQDAHSLNVDPQFVSVPP